MTVDDVLKAARIAETGETITKMSTIPSDKATPDNMSNDVTALKKSDIESLTKDDNVYASRNTSPQLCVTDAKAIDRQQIERQ